MNRVSASGLVGIVAATLSLTSITAQAQEPTVTLNLASTFPSSVKLIGEAFKALPERIARASGGEIEIKFNEPGALVPAAESVNAVSQGSIDAAWAGGGWFSGVDTAFNMFSSVPFGPGIGEYMAWMYYGGGLEIAREMYAKYDIHNVPCAIIPPEASGWFREEIKSPDDLKGLKMRFFGLGAQVMEKLGVATQQLAPGEIFQALQLGTIDATEFSLPALDQGLGFFQVAKYYYFPGWHQQATFFDLFINKAKWDSLSDKHQAIIELACGDMIRQTIAQGEAIQGQALAEIEQEGVTLMEWSPEMLDAYRQAWDEVVTEQLESNPSFKRVWESFSSFRDEYAKWEERAYLR